MPKDESNNEIAEALLLEILEKAPEDWIIRKQLAQLLYNEGKTSYAADIIWEAPTIPPVDLEIGFAIKVLSKGSPRRAIRLLTFIQENNQGKHVQNLGIANALLHYGLVLQAAKFYGAAVAGDSSLASADLEHFLLWVDDTQKIWGDFPENKPDIGELPWMKRDDEEAANLKKAMMGHTTPIRIPNLQEVSSEKIVHDLYEQSNKLHSKITPPPAVSIPIEQVNQKDIIYDDEKGAVQPVSAEQAANEKEAKLKANPVGSVGQPLPPVAAVPIPKPLVVEPKIAAPVTPSPIIPRPMNDSSPIPDSLLSQPNSPLSQITDTVVANPFAADARASSPVTSESMAATPKVTLPKMPESAPSPFATEPDVPLPEVAVPEAAVPMVAMPKLAPPETPEIAASLPESEPVPSGPMIAGLRSSLPKVKEPDLAPSPFKY